MSETLALPVRLLGHAAAGEILVSSEMWRLVEGWCECQPHPGPPGIEAHVVEGLKPLSRPLSRFVGRARELAVVADLLEQVQGVRGQVVGIMGEPGIGKSRLLYEMRQHLMAQAVTYLEGHCLAYGHAIPYLPVLELLRQHCGTSRASAMRPDSCWRKSTTGSPRALTPPTCKRPEHF